MRFFEKSKSTITDDLNGSYVISAFDLAYNLSKIIDLVNRDLSNHHHRVAYISAAIASACGLTHEKIINTVIAALIHDIGVMLDSEFKELSKFDSSESSKLSHSAVGAFLVSRIESFKHLSDIISKHHFQYSKYPEVEDEALIIHLADRIDVLLKRATPAYYQRDDIKKLISEYSGKYFKPSHVDSFLSLYDKEFFWLDIDAPYKDKLLKKYFIFDTLVLSKEDILSFTHFLSHIIDFRCSFTATHSAGVSSVASKLGELIGLPEHMTTNLRIAGYLHDLGKLAINPYIINKNGQLSTDERIEIKKHTYYTYYVLNSMDIFENIKEWAAFHHEFLDGTGYPFHLEGDRLDLGCRIMTVADIFTALSEDRPYRKGLAKTQILETLIKLCSSGKIDRDVVNTVIKNYDEIESVRKLSQLVVTQKYQEFRNLLLVSNISLNEETEFFTTYNESKKVIGDVLNILHFEEVVNNIDDIIIILNSDRRAVFANAKALNFFNKPIEKILNKKPGEIFDCIYGDDDQCGTTQFCKYCSANNSTNQTLKGIFNLNRCEIKTANNKLINFYISTIPIKTDKGDFILFILKDSNDQYSKMLETAFYSDVLNIVDNTYSLLDAYKKGDLKIDIDILDLLTNNISIIYQEIESQKFISMAKDNIIKTHFEEFPAKFIENNIRNIFYLYENINFEFKYLINNIFSDKILLNRIILNMVKNAIEAGDQPKTISITFAGDDKHFKISVHNPEYIPQEIQSKIFKEQFTTKKDGNGLGTICVKLLTEKYLGGKTYFISTPEYGTTFSIEFPNIKSII